MSLNLFILWVALNLMPAQVSSFTFTPPSGRDIEYAKQPAGGWRAVAKDEPVGPTLDVSGAELTVVGADGKKMSFPMAVMGVETGIVWKTVESIPLGSGSVKISRLKGGLDLMPSSDQPVASQAYRIRWGKPQP